MPKQENLNIAIRLAEESDVEDYKKIRLEAVDKEPKAYNITEEKAKKINERKDGEWLEDLKNKNGFVYLVKEGNETVGMAAAELDKKIKDTWLIRAVYLKEELQGKGI